MVNYRGQLLIFVIMINILTNDTDVFFSHGLKLVISKLFMSRADSVINFFLDLLKVMLLMRV